MRSPWASRKIQDFARTIVEKTPIATAALSGQKRLVTPNRLVCVPNKAFLRVPPPSPGGGVD